MIFTETKLKGAYIVDLKLISDDRGFFARTWCNKEMKAQGLTSEITQANTAFSNKKGTLRGFHYQKAPYQEAKLVRCIKGSVYDVIVDLRPSSETYHQWFGIELTADNRKMLYVPEDFGHAYLTLEDNSEVFYQVTQFYNPEAESGFCWDDPTVNVEWPIEPLVISEKDRSLPNL